MDRPMLISRRWSSHGRRRIAGLWVIFVIAGLISATSLDYTKFATQHKSVRKVYCPLVAVTVCLISAAFPTLKWFKASELFNFKFGLVGNSIVTISRTLAAVLLAYVDESSFCSVVFFFATAVALLAVQILLKPSANLGLFDFLLTSAALQTLLWDGKLGFCTWMAVAICGLLVFLRNYAVGVGEV